MAQASVRCPNCWLEPHECTQNETPPYEAIPGWVLCPRCPGGATGLELDEEAEEVALSRAIREAARGRVLPDTGPSDSARVGGRKKERVKKSDLRPEQEMYAGPPPRDKVSSEVYDPKSEIVTVGVPGWVRDWADAQAWNRGCFVTDVVRTALGEVLTVENRNPLDISAAEKDKRTAQVSVLLTAGERSLIVRTAKGYGIDSRAFILAVLANEAREYRCKCSNAAS